MTEQVGLYQKHCPTDFDQVKGQDVAVAELQALFHLQQFPAMLLLVGDSGTGKSTLAKIVASKLTGRPWSDNDPDMQRRNSADDRGIAFVREQRLSMRMLGAFGRRRVCILEEAHQITHDAQQAMLDMVENPCPHFKWIFTTTQPGKLLPAMQTRPVRVTLQPVCEEVLAELVFGIALKETGIALCALVTDAIAEQAQGSPRLALTVLERVLGLPSEEQMLQSLRVSSGEDTPERSLAKLICDPASGTATWAQLAACLRDVKDPEQARRAVLGYADAVATSRRGTPPDRLRQAHAVLRHFRHPTYDSGRPGLTCAVLDVLREVSAQRK
jgi:DNA polymerase III gamma/tau subunit